MPAFVFTFVHIFVTFGSKHPSPGCIVLYGAVFTLLQRKRGFVQLICDNVAFVEYVIASSASHTFTDATRSRNAVTTGASH